MRSPGMLEIEGLQLKGYGMDPVEGHPPFTHLLRTTANPGNGAYTTYLAQIEQVSAAFIGP